jgi:hypothetical protein
VATGGQGWSCLWIMQAGKLKSIIGGVVSNLWLYPVSERSGYVFDGQPDTSLKSFRAMIASGEGDGPWSITTNRQAVQRGDGLVIYEAQSGKNPPMIIGTGLVRKAAEWNEEEERYQIDVKLDRAECKRLADFPIDASYLKDRLQSRKQAVVVLPASLRRWVTSSLRIQERFQPNAREALDALRTKAKTVKIAGRAYEAILRHDARLIAPLRERLRDAGWRILAGYANGVSADLIALRGRGDRLLLLEGKTVGPKGSRTEIRYAIGQLHDYEYFFVPTLNLPKAKCDRLILLERKPEPKFVDFVESLNIGLAWLAGKRILGGPVATKMLKEISASR